MSEKTDNIPEPPPLPALSSSLITAGPAGNKATSIHQVSLKKTGIYIYMYYSNMSSVFAI